MTNQLAEDRRREAFAALVAVQDRGLSVADSRRQIAAEYGIDEPAVADIEREGVREQWPPLDE